MDKLEKVRKEIERRIQTLEEIEKASSDDNRLSLCNTKILALYGILNFIDSMQKESDLTKNEQKISNAYCRKVRDKRILPTLKGELKHEFINEFNTLYQTLDMQLCDKCMKEPLKEVCLAFATWGAYKLKDIGRVDEEERTKMDSMQEEPVSEELEKAANQIVNKAIPPLAQKYEDGNYVGGIRDYFDRKEFIDLVKAGANWQKQQMMKDATDVTVHIDVGNYPYIQQLELYDYDNDVALAKEGDKYKVVLIKEE